MTAAKKKIDATLSGLALKAINVFVIWLYFFWWSRKTRRRHRAKVASLGILSVSTLLLAGELIIEAAGAERVAQLVQRLGAAGPVAEWLIAMQGWVPLHYAVFLFVLIAVVFLVWHHVREAKKPGYEYRFVKRLSDVLLSGSPKEKRVEEAIAMFHSAFERSGIKYVSVHTKDAVKNDLHIAEGHVYPKPADSDKTYTIRLKEGEGIAGRVFVGETNEAGKQRYLPRYAPRLSWFRGRAPFPHAVKFAFVVEQEAPGATVKHLELGDEDIETDVFVIEPNSAKPNFTSFLSVPMLTADSRCVGVLNFDFDTLDPLAKSDIAMAVVFGLVLGRELI